MPWISEAELDHLRQIARDRFDRITYLEGQYENANAHRDRLARELDEAKRSLLVADAAHKHAANHTNYFQGEIRRLTDVIVELRREGFDMPREFPAVPGDNAPRIPDEIKAAIESRADRGTENYRELYKQAREGLRDGVDPETIVRQIRLGAAWRPSDEPAD